VSWLQQHAGLDRILYIVLTKGIPLRIRGTSGTVEDVIGLIGRGSAPAREGRILHDRKAGVIDAVGNIWLKAAADGLRSRAFGNRVVLETTSRVLSGEKNVLGYYSWGSNDWAITSRRFGFGFVPGALAAMYVSSDGRTFTEPPAAWTIGKRADGTTFHAGSPQSLAGDLIREGVTGVKLHTVIVVPTSATDAPILLTRTPYNAAALTSHAQSAHLGPVLNGYDNASDLFVEGGSIRVVQDAVGFAPEPRPG
jgi:hypothetical protein